jgi:hypothetical protein
MEALGLGSQGQASGRGRVITVLQNEHGFHVETACLYQQAVNPKWLTEKKGKPISAKIGPFLFRLNQQLCAG